MNTPTTPRATEIYRSLQRTQHARNDRNFARLHKVQYGAAILVALLVSPATWAGRVASPHVHLAAALVVGGVLTGLPVFLARSAPGQATTRYVIAASQLGYSALFIHLSGGRIETHFHIFGSLAFLVAYRDVRVILVATVVVAGDHILRALLWPESLFGVMTSGLGRALEHAAWVVFENIFILNVAREADRDMVDAADAQAKMETQQESVAQAAVEAEAQRQVAEVAEAEARRNQEELGATVERLQAVLARVASRDLRARASESGTALDQEIGRIVNQATANLDDGLSQVAHTTLGVTKGANAIASDSQEIAHNASAQAAALEEISGSVRELASVARRGEEANQEAQQLSMATRAAAEEGQRGMAALTEAIDRIRASANETAQVVQAVDDIAFQTNLLALNAAVEAARAGAAGRGFAVVADEVRNLAVRSAKAARETAERIQGAVSHADAGSQLKDEVTAQFSAIHERILKVEAAMETAAARSVEQRASIEQISETTEVVAGQTQATAASCQRSLDEAQQLQRAGEALRQVVDSFERSDAGHSRPSLRLVGA